jgi:hypothetical protein
MFCIEKFKLFAGATLLFRQFLDERLQVQKHILWHLPRFLGCHPCWKRVLGSHKRPLFPQSVVTFRKGLLPRFVGIEGSGKYFPFKSQWDTFTGSHPSCQKSVFIVA